MSKELYITTLEELLTEGMDYDEAGEKAYTLMRDRLLEQADRIKDRAKEEGKWP